jgi:putative hydrolase of the HAD superfamily
VRRAAEAFRLYDDTTEALHMFRDAGWRQAIVSNHCPELESLVDGLGIGSFFDKVHSSACTGYEKGPYPRSIGLALEYFEVDVAWRSGTARSPTSVRLTRLAFRQCSSSGTGQLLSSRRRRSCSVRAEPGRDNTPNASTVVSTRPFVKSG